MKKTYRILIVSSTDFEIKKFISKLSTFHFLGHSDSYSKDQVTIDVLISGIGIAQTVYHLTKKLSLKSYDLVINAGICGSFTDRLPIGACVHVTSDEFADTGMSYPDRSFKTLFEEGLMSYDSLPFTKGCLNSGFQMSVGMNLYKAKGITVNSCSGDSEQIKSRKEHFNADIESMEGAAVSYVCLSEKVNFIQIRAVSNIIEPRNKERWNIERATDRLADCLFELIVFNCGL